MLGLFAKSFIVDSVIESLNSCKYFVVITEEKEKACDAMTKGIALIQVMSDNMDDRLSYVKEAFAMLETKETYLGI